MDIPRRIFGDDDDVTHRHILVERSLPRLWRFARGQYRCLQSVDIEHRRRGVRRREPHGDWKVVQLMQITFSPQRSDATLTVAKTGDTLVINGVAFDFSVIPEGGILPAAGVDCDFVIGDIRREDGALKLTMMPYRSS
ncbi:MAG TPA: hypothetical protein VL202_01795 [Pararhizobium sp.]|uniref:hypothetical protein n=1 Tax=Pararhizobium sp. TaxID=1977563 RepID=UPI002C68AF5A|nr:hypothetical protein [Pararhizobium sp.]HTO29903.1 hypothetical protein [Pararhizobium sp.]